MNNDQNICTCNLELTMMQHEPECPAVRFGRSKPDVKVDATKHCKTCVCERRAPVQQDHAWNGPQGGRVLRGPGTIAWAEHELAWSGYAVAYESSAQSQSAEQKAQRGGFSYGELIMFLGREPTTWVPRGREQK